MSTHSDAAAELIATGHRLSAAGILASFEGNLSLLLSDDRVLTTPTGAHKGDLSAESLVVSDRSGKRLAGGRPSSELKMQTSITLLKEVDDLTFLLNISVTKC